LISSHDQMPGAWPADGNQMLEDFLRILVKVLVASLIVGTILGHFGITTQELLRGFGLSPDRVIDLGRKGVAWVLPNMLLGAFIIVPIWFVIFLFRPPGESSSDD
jgi:hypothetical protein